MQGFTDKEVLGDGLSTQKSTTEIFNTFSNECVHDDLRNTMLKILEQEHSIQNEVFNMMHQRGFYEVPSAKTDKIRETQQKFAQSFQ
jgi:spore coat protein CotF